jgi:hypothetical protein
VAGFFLSRTSKVKVWAGMNFDFDEHNRARLRMNTKKPASAVSELIVLVYSVLVTNVLLILIYGLA